MKSRTIVSLISSVPICAITGLNGAGKTMLAVSAGVEYLEAGGTVLSTVQIVTPGGRRSIPLRSLSQLIDARDCMIILDEVSTVFSSRGAPLAPELVTLLQVLRKRGCQVIWTAPSWKRTDVILREVSVVQLAVTPVLRRRAEPGALWRNAVLSRVDFLDRRDATDEQAVSTIARLRRPGFIRLSRLSGFGAYDTRADSPQIGGLTTAGACPDCGGKRPQYACSPMVHARLGIEQPIDPVEQMKKLLAVSDTLPDFTPGSHFGTDTFPDTETVPTATSPD